MESLEGCSLSLSLWDWALPQMCWSVVEFWQVMQSVPAGSLSHDGDAVLALSFCSVLVSFSVFMALSTIYFFMKVILSPDKILFG